MISRGYAVRHILFVEISRKTGYDLIRGRDVVKCHDLFFYGGIPMDRLWTHSMKHYRCTNLNYVKSLFTDEYSEKTTYSWLSGVSPYRYVRQEQRRYLDSKINGVNPTKNGIYCLNVSFFTRFRRLISNFCIKFYLNVYICKVTQNFIIYGTVYRKGK